VRRRFRRTLVGLARVGVSVVLLAWLLARVELGGVLEAIGRLSPELVCAAVLMHVATQVLSSVRWWSLARALDFPGKWHTYLGFYFVGTYFNLFLPTSVGGDLLKVLFLTREEGRRLRATYSVVADRLFGLAAMLILGASAVLMSPNVLPRRFVTLLFSGGVAALCWLAWWPFLIRGIARIWPEIAQRLAGLVVFWRRPWALSVALTLSLILQALGMGVVALLARGIGIDLPLEFYFASFPLVAILTLLPISFNGIGLREGGFIFFLGLKGVPAEVSLTLGLVFFGVQISSSLVGAVAYAMGVHRRPLDRREEEVSR
jgi:uncharacterized membrane protein YbhN (UPF0104 family)